MRGGKGGMARFWGYVEKGPGCWPYGGCLNDEGYGVFGRRERGETAAHRIAYVALVGPIPEGMQLDHMCHNDSGCAGGSACLHRRCVNPAHLVPTTARENTLRGQSFSALNARKTHCPAGHEYDELNARLYLGRRYCRGCERDRNHEKQARRKGRPVPTHGIQAGYNRGCRCDLCREARRAADRSRARRKPAA